MENFIILDDINVTPLLKAHDTFKHGLKIAHSQLERDGVIQRFEYTLELSWKLLRKILKFKGIKLIALETLLESLQLLVLYKTLKFGLIFFKNEI